MKTIRVKLKERSHNIVIGYNTLSSLPKFITQLKLGYDAYIITNPYIKKRYGKILSSAFKKSGLSVRFKVLPDSEKTKSIKTVSLVIEDLTRYDKKRRIFIVAFGGGVVGDLAGFVASVYKRGIPYIQVPTTLLAQVDSAIGGKTAVDLSTGKNLVGAFYQPRLVFTDNKLLESLPKKEIQSGLAEVIKYGIIKDVKLFNFLEERYKDVLILRPSALEFIVSRCSAIKADIVSRDEKEEKGIRTVLNFGHTIAHAIEAAGNFKAYSHGQAVGLGVLVATDISRRLGLINGNIQERIRGLIRNTGLPVKVRNISFSAIIKAHYRDKKFIGVKNRLVLIKGIGRALVVKNVPLEVIKNALREIF